VAKQLHSTVKKSSRHNKNEKKRFRSIFYRRSLTENNGTAFVFLLPMLIGIFGLVLFPILESFRLSFYIIQPGAGINRFVGLMNYRFAFSDFVLWRTLGTTIKMALMEVVITVPLTFIIATLINNAYRVGNIYKVVYYLPNITSVTATAIVFRFVFYSSEMGIVNYVLSWFNIAPIGWLTSVNYAPITVVIFSFWLRMGFNVLICLAALQTISKEMYEAADIDGANPLKKWWYITIPRSRPILMYVLIMTLIGAMKRFNETFVLGGEEGLPGGSLFTTVMYMYTVAFKSANVTYGATISVLLFIIIFIMTFVNMKFIKFNDSDY
jgi:multiple sugar transport system permease protein